jgi:hypothetical protein
MARTQQDAGLSASIALPNAANTVNTNAIDLGTQNPFPTSERYDVVISTTAGTGAADKNITIVLQGSSEAAANFTNITGLSTVVINETSLAYPATTSSVKLPPGFAKRYIRASAAGEATGGNAADGTLTISVRC